MLLGLIDEAEKRARAAQTKWKKAAEIAKKLRDKELRFRAEFFLYKRALKDGDAAVARSIGRRLHRMAPAIPVAIDEINEFKQLASGKKEPSRHSVSFVQRDLPSTGN
jgi:hypothetical protein